MPNARCIFTKLSPKLAPRPLATCSGPVGLAETNSISIFSLLCVPAASLFLRRLSRAASTKKASLSFILIKPGAKKSHCATSSSCSITFTAFLAMSKGFFFICLAQAIAQTREMSASIWLGGGANSTCGKISNSAK